MVAAQLAEEVGVVLPLKKPDWESDKAVGLVFEELLLVPIIFACAVLPISESEGRE